jgi:flagellar basal body-associated protein FliL
MNEALDDFGPLLKDRIATVAIKMTFDELEGPNGPEVLKQEIRDTLNRSLKNRLNGVIIAVHFDDFLIQ